MPIVVTGFEPLDVLEGIRRVVLPARGRAAPSWRTPTRAPSSREGNPAAQAVVREVFTTCDRAWRGIGMIPQSGWRLADDYADFDAEQRFDVAGITTDGVAAVPQRRGAAGPDQAEPVRGLRHGVHAAHRRWARPWSPARARARPTTSSAARRRR